MAVPSEVELRLLLELTEAISGAADHARALERVVARICEAAGWRYGEAWIGPHDGALERVASSSIDPGAPGDGAQVAHQTTTDGVATWAELGGELPHAVAFPIKRGPRALGAVVFRSVQPIPRDGKWIAVIAVVTAQLGLWLERKQIDDALRERTRQLESTNRQLEEFAAVASHDLQEPLRKIRAFTSRVQGMLAAHLDDTSADYLGRIEHAAVRMQQLVDDLLAFAQLARPAPRVAVDLPAITRAVLRDLEAAIEASAARIVVGELPTISGVPLQLRQLMQNLISNALKFTRPGVPPEVRISSERTDQAITIVVEDNGIGFAPEHAARIFGMLQRLHARGAYPGTGMGLAICRRIVEGHGGEITARSAPDRGSTFLVTLPLTKAAPS